MVRITVVIGWDAPHKLVPIGLSQATSLAVYPIVVGD